MSWMQRMLHSEPGPAIDGPLGEVAHAAAKDGSTLNDHEQRASAFFVAAFSMVGKMAEADGHVSLEEIEALDHFIAEELACSPEARRFGVRVFTEARHSKYRLKEFAKQFRRLFKHDEAPRIFMLEILHRIATADGVVHPDERALLIKAARALKISDDTAEHIRRQFTPEADHHRAILRCALDAPPETIEAQYRALTAAYDPETFASRGVPEEFKRLARKRMAEVEEAYHVLTGHAPHADPLDALIARGEKHPESAEAQIAAAYACDREGDEARAITFYDAAWKLGVPADEHREFCVGYGSTLRNVGRHDEAVTILEEAIRRWPNDGALRAFRALALVDAGRGAEAVGDLIRLVCDLDHASPSIARYRNPLLEYARTLLD